MSTTFFTLGLVLTLVVVLQIGLGVVGAVRQIVQNANQSELSAQLMQKRIEALALRNRQLEPMSAWKGYRKFVVARIVDVADGTCSLHLVPQDGKRLPDFEAGQQGTLRLLLDDKRKPEIHGYSLADSPPPDHSRITIQHVSNALHDRIEEGSVLDVKAPSGHFVLAPFDPNRVEDYTVELNEDAHLTCVSAPGGNLVLEA